MDKAPRLSQDADALQNRRAIDFVQRESHGPKLGSNSGGKALKQDEATLRSIWCVDLTNEMRCLVGGPRHHARRAVGLEV